jgi:hypothetical protein
MYWPHVSKQTTFFSSRTCSSEKASMCLPLSAAMAPLLPPPQAAPLPAFSMLPPQSGLFKQIQWMSD